MLKRTLACFFALYMACGQAGEAQQTPEDYTDVKEWPKGIAGERVRAAFEAVNSNDSGRVRAFVKEHFTPGFRDRVPIERLLAFILGVYDQSRGFEFMGVRRFQEERAPGEVVIIVRNKLAKTWEGLVFELESEPPHRIAGLSISPARPPSYLPPPGAISAADIPVELEAYADRLAEADVFSGTVLLAKDGKVLFKKAYGLASKRFMASNRIDTKFNLGSMNKMFTGVSITQLVQAGKLALDDPLSKYLSTDWLSHEISEKIRIKHLLTHTSGLGSYFNRKYMESSKALFRNLDDYMPLIRSETLAFEPGTDWRYSNTGMFLLGVVIEKVTGQSYFDYVREQIYQPAGMVSSDCYEMDRPVSNLAIGYSKERSGDPPWTNNLYKHVVKGGPAGGGFSTVEDLLRFDMALRSHKLLDGAHTEMVWSAKPELNSPEYGFGFGVYGEPGDRIVGHGGGFAGINSNLDMFLDSGYTAVVMSNYDNGAMPVRNKMRELIRRAR